MPRKSSGDEPRSEAPECAARIRAAVENDRERLLRSIAVQVSKARWRVRRTEVMELAADVLGEAVREALANAENFDPRRSATAWVRGIAARVLLSRRREEARCGRCVPATVLGEDGWAAALEGCCVGPSDEAVAGRLDLEQALGRITPEERRVIEFRYYRGLDGQELAQALGLTTSGAARVRLCRALQALRAQFPRTEGEGLR
jgi:RNA polymerase sigma factor (sigma-70 family)